MCSRKNPMSCCKGKCYLKKEIAADEDQQQPAGKVYYQKDIQLDMLLHQSDHKDFLFSPFMPSYVSFYLMGEPQQYIDSLFQPPQYI